MVNAGKDLHNIAKAEGLMAVCIYLQCILRYVLQLRILGRPPIRCLSEPGLAFQCKQTSPYQISGGDKM
jgi:hypothetical protein